MKKTKKKKTAYQKLSKLFTVFTIIGVFGWIILFGLNRVIGEETASSGVVDIDKEPKKEELNILIAGMNEMLTDTMIFCRYNTNTNKLYMMSIPRDTYITSNVGVGHKLNALYRGKNLDEFLDMIEKLLDVEIDYYAIFSTDFIGKVVDSIGGVEFYVPQDMYYVGGDPIITIDLKVGKQILDGNKAEQLLRFRSGYKNADLDRVNVQRDFIKEFIKTVAKPKNIIKINKIAKVAFDNMETNASLREGLKYVTELKDIDTENIESVTMPNKPEYIKGISYVVADTNEAQRIIREDWNQDYVQNDPSQSTQNNK